MKSAVLTKKRQFEFIEEDIPKITHPDDVLVKVAYVSICADDLIFFNQEHVDISPHAMCHEFSGIIVALGQEAEQAGFSVGDRVSGYPWLFCGKCPNCRSGKENLCINLNTSQGCTKEYILLKDRQIYQLPDSVSLVAGSMTELVATGLHGFDRAHFTPGKSVLILGGGGAGLTLLQLALIYGGCKVTVSEPLSAKRSLAQKFGAEFVINPSEENLFLRSMQITQDLGYDLIVDATGKAQTLNGSVGLLARGGTLLVFSFHYLEKPFLVDLSELYYKECSICTSYNAPYMLPKACELLKRLQMETLVGKIFPFSQIQQAFEIANHGYYPRVVFQVAEDL